VDAYNHKGTSAELYTRVEAARRVNDYIKYMSGGLTGDLTDAAFVFTVYRLIGQSDFDSIWVED